MNFSEEDVFDGDSPFISYDGVAVGTLTWHEGGVYLLTSNTNGVNVGEDVNVECGVAITPIMDLHLRFGQEVTAKFARFGE